MVIAGSKGSCYSLYSKRTRIVRSPALIDTLHQERLELKESAREFENNNEKYINIKERGNNEMRMH